MPFAEYDEMVQALVLHPLHPGLRVGIHVRRSRRNWPEFDALGFQDIAKLLGELAVSVTNDVRRLVLIGFVVEYTDANGRPRSEARKVGAALDAGEVTSVNTRIGPYTAGGNCPVRITTARIAESN